MTKLEFMRELESLLLDIPLEEREEALKFYNGYFEDAGGDREADIITELGTPMKIADIIKADLNSNAGEYKARGYFTENGYQDDLVHKEMLELVGSGESSENHSESKNTEKNRDNGRRSYTEWRQNSGYDDTYQQRKASAYHEQKNKRNGSSPIGWIILICIFAIPIGIPLLCTVFGVVIAVIGVIVGLIVSFGGAGIALIGSGIVLFVSGLLQMSMPLIGLAFCGAGMLITGIGMLFISACAAFCTKVLPSFIRGIAELCRIPFRNRRVMA